MALILIYVVKLIIPNNIQKVSVIVRTLENANADGIVTIKLITQDLLNQTIFYLNVLKGSWHQLLDSGIKNRVFYLKKIKVTFT